ncbi:MAG: hypothetical protein COA86_07620 [Kangiella sp.]|nr:MAG: hypothetical protein COA86_07620 [Kangiella sp.]
MKLFYRVNHLIRLIITATVFLISLQVSAAGLLTPASNTFPPLDLAEHHVDVMIENGYSITTVTQIFENPHATDLEAIYSFPVPKHAAVAEFSIWIDGKQVVGEVLEKKRAKTIYQKEKDAGNTAGLTEKNDYKTFQINVTPIRANKNTKIQIRYYQQSNVDLGIGRWVYQLEDGGVDEEALSFWNTNSNVSKSFSFNLTIRSGYPIDAVRLPNHAQAKITQISPQEWQVTLNKKGSTSIETHMNNDDETRELQQTYRQSHPMEEMALESNSEVQEKHIEPKKSSSISTTNQSNNQNVFDLNQDIVVYWRHQQGLPGSIDLVSYRTDKNAKGTFMMTFTPGDELSPISKGRDWNFILDISGSMQGKFSSLVEGVSQSIKKMNHQDRIRIILFNNIAHELTQGYEYATPENIQHILSQLKQVSPDNGTNLYAGLEKGLDSLNSDRATGIILVTDGVANVGNTEKKHFFRLLEKSDVRLFTFIMGNSANQPMLEPLARRSGGFALNISNADDIVGRVMQATQKLSHQAFHDVQVKIDGVKVSDLTPKHVGSLYQGQQLIVMGHYWKPGLARVELRTKVSGQEKIYSTQINFPDVADLNPELERLWSYAKITDLEERMQDFANEDHKQAITEIALEYGLVTDYTSMLVLQDEQFQAYNIKRNNKNRVEREAKARVKRSKTKVTSTRADRKQPAFNKPRPSPTGGGSLSWLLIVMLSIKLFNFRKHCNSNC